MLNITLTKEQTAQLHQATRGIVTVTLTKEQYETVKKRFPKLAVMKMTVTLPSRGLAAPFIPGGTVVSAAVSGIGQSREALATVSEA